MDCHRIVGSSEPRTGIIIVITFHVAGDRVLKRGVLSRGTFRTISIEIDAEEETVFA